VEVFASSSLTGMPASSLLLRPPLSGSAWALKGAAFLALFENQHCELGVELKEKEEREKLQHVCGAREVGELGRAPLRAADNRVVLTTQSMF
jgi:hypothetical protein